MEFDFDISSVLPGRITHLQPSELTRLPSVRTSCLRQLIDTMGRLSSEAQELSTVITTYSKFVAAPDQHLFILRDPTSTSKTPNCRVLGFLKVGVKDLFFHDETGNWSEKLQPFCLLDFYVHESEQRRGRGLELIDTLLKDLPSHANLSLSAPMKASYFAFDRPSPKLLGFLKKQFQLHPPIEQNNNFVVYSDFFRANPVICVDSASSSTTSGPDKRVKHFGYNLDNKNSNKMNSGKNTNFNNVNKNSPSHSSKAISSGNSVMVALGLDRENSSVKRQQAPQQRIDKMSHVFSRHEYSSQDRSTKKATPVIGQQATSSPSKSGKVFGEVSQNQQPKKQQQQQPNGLGSLRPPFACQGDMQEELQVDWRSGSNKRFQRTALW